VNKKELVALMSEISGQSKLVSEKSLDAFVEAVSKTLKLKEEIRLVGFGTFYVTEREKTIGRNPRTGNEISIPASTQPKFKAGKNLKDDVN